MPCVVISVTEDDVVGTHLYTAVELIPSDIVGDGVRTYEITFTIFIVFEPDTWSVVDHACSAGISICHEFGQTSFILVVVFVGKDKMSIIRIDFSMCIGCILPRLWWFFQIGIDVVDVSRPRVVPTEFGFDVLFVWFTKNCRFIGKERSADQLNGLITKSISCKSFCF